MPAVARSNQPPSRLEELVRALASTSESGGGYVIKFPPWPWYEFLPLDWLVDGLPTAPQERQSPLYRRYVPSVWRAMRC